ncbi:DUF222 domain-containing protein [Corynebacterium timonense]|uniref:DUF222 domain-containing protein n=1 Tax=Corynebacterium timonense TaxID=441500 RepID=A0A1H1RH12_9CORY|nr:DUF222 domain-containing protein [Corynebacterium timonense]SDS35087.1 protein of unknown function [Corynebacterium timonense]
MTTPPTTISCESAPADIAAAIEHAFGMVTRRKAHTLWAIALFDANNLASHFGARTTATWLIRTLDIPTSTAHEYVKIARAMHGFPVMAAAFRNGEITYSKARLLTVHWFAPGLIEGRNLEKEPYTCPRSTRLS